MGLIFFESLARIGERFASTEPVDARSPIEFQKLPDAPVLENVQIDGEDFRSLAWGGRPPALMPAQKGDEIRIVLVGGSAAEGMGIAPTANFATHLERILNKVSARRVRVINMGRTGYASPQLTWLLSKAVPLVEPDLILTVMGNNEYLDMQFQTQGVAKPLRLTLARRMERHFALARFFRPEQKTDTNVAPAKHLEAMGKISAGDREAADAYVTGRLKRSIQNMALSARDNGCRMLVCTVPVNIRYANLRQWFFAGDGNAHPVDFIKARWAMRYGAPEKAAEIMKSRIGVDGKDFPARFVSAMALRAAGMREQSDNAYRELVAEIESPCLAGGGFGEWYIYIASSVAIEGQAAAEKRAEVWFDRMKERTPDAYSHWQLANMHLALGDIAEARRLFVKAMDMGGHIIRAGGQVNYILQLAASAAGVDSFDLKGEFEHYVPGGFLGYEYFLDYCHYNARGHILAAHLLAGPVSAALGIKGRFPSAQSALDKELEMRKGRETDLADLRWWTGADFDVTYLVNEAIDSGRNPRSELRRHVEQYGESARAATYLGNWMVAEQLGDWGTTDRNDMDKISGKASRRQYAKALEMSPDFKPAKANLEIYMRYLR